MLKDNYKTTYYYAEQNVVIEYLSEKRNLTVISSNHSIAVHGLNS
jgi:hypothetical protein